MSNLLRLTMIAAMFVFAGQVFAATGKPAKESAPAQNTARKVAPSDESGNPTGDHTPSAPSSVLAAPPANDTCAGAEALTLNQVKYGNTTDANDDYHSPNNNVCFAGNGQYPQAATGRDVVYSFTAPAAGKYTFRSSARDVTSTSYGPASNITLYLTDCGSAGGPDPKTVNCLKGGNAMYGQIGVGSGGQNSLIGEAVSCYPMAAGETTFLVFDDSPSGRCSDNNHRCKDASYCAAGATCVPQINGGGTISLEVIACQEEAEPNDSPATASALSCGVTGAAAAAPVAHCYLGDRAGQACDRSYAAVAILDQANEDANMRCAVSNAMCVLDVALGTDNCAAGTGPCQSHTDFDCDPRCDTGPNAGKACTTHAFCNPVSDQGATCAGACFIERTCVDNVTGVNTGIACTPTCQGSSIPSVNGRMCVSVANFNACPGGGVCTTTPFVPTVGATCSVGQTCSQQFNEGDADFYSVGSPVAGSKVFTAVWANNANDYDYRMRVTNGVNTLQFDDNDAVSFFGGTASSVIGGAVTDGGPTYIQVSRTQVRATNTYQVYSIVRPPLAAAQVEDESGPFGNNITFYWPGDVIVANPVGAAGGYVRGTFGFNGDSDCFRFLANKGDQMDWIGDGGPARAVGGVATVSDPFPIIYDAEPAGIANYVFGTEVKKNQAPNVAGPGLKALTPAVTSGYESWRASYTGMLEVCWYNLTSVYPTAGATTFPVAYAGSMATNCGNTHAAGPGTTTADVSIAKTGPAGPVETGEIFDYTITVTNDSDEIAQSVEVYDQLDPSLSFVQLSVDDTLAGNNTACFSLPSLGLNDAPIDCINTSMAPHTVTVYTVTVQVNNCIGDGVPIANQADIIFTESTDPDPSNNSASAPNLVTVAQANNGCTDIVCSDDDNTCWEDLCTVNSFCEAGVCNNSEQANCDDNNVCTDDTCDSRTGCINDSSQVGGCYSDFNPCTFDACDPILGCVFPPAPPGTACDDELTCTTGDACDGAGSCSGQSVCDDGNECTDDFANEANACACSHGPVPEGTPCDDENACAGGDQCDGNGVCFATMPVDCDDNNPCTNDACDPLVGCTYDFINCDDLNACNGPESCDVIVGCVSGPPVVCTASDQCHDAGVCSPGSGLCSNPAKADGSACDDGNAGTSGDSCQGGVCTGSACTSTNDPKTKGWYKSLCHNAHSGDSLSDADAACVGALTNTFAGISTVAQICAVLEPSNPNNDKCSKVEDQLMTLALNICKQRVCPSNAIDSSCGNNSTVAQSLAQSDAILDNPSRTTAQCNQAECLDKEINNGHALELDSLLSMREGTGLRLSWHAPYADDGQGHVNHYTIYRRAVGSKLPFVQIGTTTGLTFLDANAATGSWEYDLVPVY